MVSIERRRAVKNPKNPKIILCDVDGTLCQEICFTIAEVEKATPRQEIVEKVNNLYDMHFIIIYTARRDHLIPATLSWLKRNGIKFHAVSNLKIPGDYLIDDMAIKPEELK